MGADTTGFVTPDPARFEITKGDPILNAEKNYSTKMDSVV